MNLLAITDRYKTQGVWVSPVLRERRSDETDECAFKTDLMRYLDAYNDATLRGVRNRMERYNYSPCAHVIFMHHDVSEFR